MDLFTEHIIKRKKGARELILIAAMILGAILLNFILLTFAQYLASFLLLFIAGVFYFLYVGITSMNVEYEYIVTNGDLDIDKIVAQRKRSKIISVHARSFEYFAPLTSEHKNAYEDSSITKRLDLTSNTGSDNVYFAIYYKNSDKILFTFEPTQKMIQDFARYVPRRVFYTK
ncbi:MAG: DUF6106 family protein [Eubacteriales bacterium]|jgi:hypothetical protein|nr:DUF6106 family protein [Eubacteriales bacterium]